MNKFLIFSCLFFFTTLSFGQKFGYINSEVIVKKLPEYKKAQSELEQWSQKQQDEIDKMKKSLDQFKESYKAEEVLLTEEMQKERMDTITAREKQLKEFQKKIFGFEGSLFLKRQELMKPIQDKVYEAVEKVAKEKQLQVIFDKAADLVMLYTNPVHDYTDYVLDKLNLGDKSDTVQH